MTFQETLEKDLAVFVNPLEFGEPLEINEVKLMAVVIKSTSKLNTENIASKREGYYIHPKLHNEPLVGNHRTVYFRTRDYTRGGKEVPKHGDFVWLNGVRYKVEEQDDSAGITKIICATDTMNKPAQEKLPRLRGLYEE